MSKSYSELSKIQSTLFAIQQDKNNKPKSSKVNYAIERNLRILKTELEAWEKANKPDVVAKFEKDRDKITAEELKMRNITAMPGETNSQFLRRVPMDIQQEISAMHEEIKDDKIREELDAYSEAKKNPDIELDLYKVKLSDFPNDYPHTDLLFDMIEE